MPTNTLSTTVIRSGLIRLAHARPDSRPALMPIIVACSCQTEAPMMGKYEEGKPADPTENMSEADKKEWELNTLRHKDQFKGAAAVRSQLIRLAHARPDLRASILDVLKAAGCEKLPEGGMRDNCEKKKSEGDKEASAQKSAGRVHVRKMVDISVRILGHKPTDFAGRTQIRGQMSLDFGGNTEPDAVVFTAIVGSEPNFIVDSFTPLKSVSGAGATILINMLRSALEEALLQKGTLLFQNDLASI